MKSDTTNNNSDSKLAIFKDSKNDDDPKLVIFNNSKNDDDSNVTNGKYTHYKERKWLDTKLQLGTNKIKQIKYKLTHVRKMAKYVKKLRKDDPEKDIK